MNGIILQCKSGGDFELHPPGIFAASCVDVMDLGLVETEFQQQKKMVPKVKLTFETEAKTSANKPFTISKSFTKSLHPKSNLSGCLGKWRGHPVLPGETIPLNKLIGASCTLVLSHQDTRSGNKYTSIDAVSKPTRKFTPSGTYDPEAARQRYAEWKAKQSWNVQPASISATQAVAPAPTKSDDPTSATEAAPATDIDPDVGF